MRKLFPKTLMMVLTLFLVGAVNLWSQSITVLTPNGGESFNQNTQQIVAWKSTGVTGNVAIKLSTDGGATYGVTLAASVPVAAGVYAWSTGTYSGSNMRIRVEGTTVNDASNANFTISGTSSIYSNNPFAISDGVSAVAMRFGIDPAATNGIDPTLGEAELPPAPPTGVFDGRWVDTTGNTNLGQGVLKDYRTGGSSFVGPKIHSVKYQLGSGDSIRIYWSLPTYITGNVRDMLGGILVNINISGTGSYTVPNPVLTQLRVQFNYAAAPGSITVTSPNGGETWLVGSQQNIVWNQTGVTTVKLEYTTDNGTSWILIGTAPAFTVSKLKDPKYHPKDPRSNLFGTLGQYQWTIPNTPSTQCKVRVSDNANASVNDMSDNVFTISSAPPPSENWTVLTSGTTSALYTVSTVDNNVAWVGSGSSAGSGAGPGLVLKTTNGGTTWTSYTAGTFDVYAIYGLDANTCFLGTYTGSATQIYKTTNGGTSWTQVYTQTGGFINAIKMFDANNGYAQGDPVGGNWTLLKTTNGGTTWTSAATLAAGSSSEAGWNNSMYWVDNNTGFFGTNNSRIYKTTNGGANWTSTTTTAVNSYSLTFANSNIGMAGFAAGVVNKTTNGGTNWTAVTTPSTASVNGFSNLGENEFFFSAGTIVYKTTNGGTNWTTSYSGTGTFYHMDIKGNSTSAVGYAVTSTGGIIKYFRGTATPSLTVTAPNGGENWVVGTQQNITWNATSVSNVKIEYSTNNGTTYTQIVASVPAKVVKPSNNGSRQEAGQNDSPLGQYVWTIPNTPSTQCLVKITDVSNPTVTDVSNAVFTISSTPPPAGDTLFYGNTPRFNASSNGGWVAGVNGYGDLGKAQRFDLETPSTVKTLVGAKFYFGAKQVVGTVDNFNVRVWTVGTNGAPNSVLYTGTITTTQMDTARNGSKATYVAFSPAVQVTGKFFIGLDWLAAVNDTMGLIYDDPAVPPAGENQKRAWEKWDTGAWYAFDSSASWGMNTDLWIAAVFGSSTTPSITLTSPVGGENWTVGSQRTITWNASNITTVKIEYTTNNGTSWNLIGTAPALMKALPKNAETEYQTDEPTGQYVWTVPNTPSTQCKVRVSDNSNAAVNSVSPNVFTISTAGPGPTQQFMINVTTLSPGSISLYGAEFDGTYFYITQWNSTGGARIYRVNKAGTMIDSFLVTGAASGLRDLAYDGQYLYGSPNSTTIYKIDPTTMTSVGTITAPQSVRGIAYDKARNGLWIGNWSTSIQLINMSGTVLQTIAATTHGLTGMSGLAYDTLTSGGPYIWVFNGGTATDPKKLFKLNAQTGVKVDSFDITNDLPTGAIGGGLYVTNQYQTGTVTLGGMHQATPHNLFGYQIGGAAQPSVTVVAPNGGEQWIVGNQYNIQWNQTGVTTVKLEYTTNNGTSWTLIGTAPGFTTSKILREGYSPKDPNSVLTGTLGSYSWTIPNTPSTQCKVRVSDNSNASITDMSDNVFSIITTPPPSETWTVQTSPSSATFYSVSVVNENIAWAAGVGGAVVKTTNGGTTWTAVNLSVAEDIYAIEAVDANLALVTTSPSATNIYRTTNGGTNWTQVYTLAGGFINAIKMFDANNGYATGDPVSGNWTLIKTTNGGASWTSASTLAQVGTEAGWNNSFFWLDNNTGFFGTNNSKLYKTTNAGTNWSPLTVNQVNSYSLAFANANNGVFGAATGSVSYTTNAGTNWTTATSGGSGSVLGTTAISNQFWVASGTGVFTSTNNGATWTSAYTGTAALNHLLIKGTPTNAYGWAVGASGRIVKYFRGTVAPSITVVSPNGGEQWPVGSQKTIQWNATNVSTVKLEYTTNNGTSWILIGTAPALMSKAISANDDVTETDEITGTYQWTVPNTISSQCKVKVSDNSNATLFDVSDNVFSIVASTPGPEQQFMINVSGIYPGAVSLYGAEFTGTTFYITQWNSTGGARIYRVNKAGTTIDSVLVTGPASGLRDLAYDGQYLYGAPNSTTISKIDPTNMTQVGTITAPTAVRGIAYNKAVNGFWIANWSTDIYLISSTGSTIRTIPAATHGCTGMAGLAYDTISAGGPYIWVFNGGTATDNKVLVKLNATTGARVDSIDITAAIPSGAIAGGLFATTQYAEGTVTIGGMHQSTPHNLFGYKVGVTGPPPSTITVISPRGGESFKAGNLTIVAWKSANYTGNVTIKLSADGGNTYPTTIATNVPDNGVYSFYLPTSAGTNYKVRVEGATTPSVFGASATSFAVVTGTAISVDNPIVVYDGFNVRYLRFGLHPTATDSIDAALGEEELPPIPPTNVFDARWIGTDIQLPKLGQGVLLDYRNGQNLFTNSKVHELYFQRGTGSTGVTIYYAMPPDISCRIQDNFTELDSIILLTGKLEISAGALAKLKVTASYFPKSITLTQPNGGEKYKVGSVQQVKWTGQGLGAVKVEYSLNNGQTYTLAGYGRNGLFNWTVPMTTSTQARVKVSDSLVTTIFDVSDNVFSIVPSAPGAFNLLQPANNARVVVRENNPTFVTIKWSKAVDAVRYKWEFRWPPLIPSFAVYTTDTVLNIPEAYIYETIKGVGMDSISGVWQVYAFNEAGDDSTRSTQVFNIKLVGQKTILSVNDRTGIPTTFGMDQNYPNPFNPTTKIQYQLPKEEFVTIEVFNMVGERVATLMNQIQKAGYYDISFDAKNLNSGIYIYRIKAGDFVSVKKMILMK